MLWSDVGHSLASFVVSLNLHRRHLTPSQRAAVAVKIANLRHGQKRADAPTGASAAVTQADAAAQLNVGRRTVQRAKEVIEKASPEDIEAIELRHHAAILTVVKNQLPSRTIGVRPSEADPWQHRYVRSRA